MSKTKLGRPKLPRESRLDNRVSFRLSEHERRILNNYSMVYGLSPSVVVRDCLMVMGVIPDWT